MSRKAADQGKPKGVAEFSRWPLNKCPWCGSGKAEAWETGLGFRVMCQNSKCFACGPVRQTELAARVAWQKGPKHG